MNFRTLIAVLALVFLLGCTSSQQVFKENSLTITKAEDIKAAEFMQKVKPGKQLSEGAAIAEGEHLPAFLHQQKMSGPSAKNKSISPTHKLSRIQSDSCDIIILKDGDEIQAKVLEIGTKEIKYKRCDNLEGPVIVIAKSKVFMVRYPNGSKSVIEQEKSDVSSALNSDFSKNQLVALLLALFLGGLGIHRFYLGYTTIGVIQLLTAGGCGIWAFIDLIRILVGDLKPKDGEYETKL